MLKFCENVLIHRIVCEKYLLSLIISLISLMCTRFTKLTTCCNYLANDLHHTFTFVIILLKSDSVYKQDRS